MTEAQVVAQQSAEYRENYGPGPCRGRTNAGIVWWCSARYSMQLARRLRRGEIPARSRRYSWHQLVLRAREEVMRARDADRRAR